MRFRACASRIAPTAWLALALLPVLATAQTIPFGDQENPKRFRDRYRKPEAGQKLNDAVRKLKSDDVQERLEAIQILGDIDDPKAVEYLVAAANDPEMSVRIKSIDTLGHLKAKEATPLLIQQLFMRDTDLGTKQRILATLGKIGDQRATKPIVDFMSRDLDPAVRGNAIFALGDLGDPAALVPLEAIANDGHDPMLKSLAAEAARKIRTRPIPTVVPPALAVDVRGARGAAESQ
jgi:HEAT repeat protein